MFAFTQNVNPKKERKKPSTGRPLVEQVRQFSESYEVICFNALVEIRSFDRNTFRQTFSRFGYVIRSYFGLCVQIWHQIECQLLYCINFILFQYQYLWQTFGKHSVM